MAAILSTVPYRGSAMSFFRISAESPLVGFISVATGSGRLLLILIPRCRGHLPGQGSKLDRVAAKAIIVERVLFIGPISNPADDSHAHSGDHNAGAHHQCESLGQAEPGSDEADSRRTGEKTEIAHRRNGSKAGSGAMSFEPSSNPKQGRHHVGCAKTDEGEAGQNHGPRPGQDGEPNARCQQQSAQAQDL